MRKEFGKWLMDVAKYIVTAVVLASVFGGAEPVIIYAGGVIAAMVSLGFGLYFVADQKEIKKSSKKTTKRKK